MPGITCSKIEASYRERGHLSTSRKMIDLLGRFFSVCTSNWVACFHPILTALSYTSLASDGSATTALHKEIFTGYLMIFRQVKQ